MTLLELANQLRQLRSEFEKEPSWDRSTAFFISFPRPGQTSYTGFCYRVGKLLRSAYLSEAFRDAYFNDVRPRMIGEDDSKLALVVLEWLHEKQFSIAGIDPYLDPFERLARAFESIDKNQASANSLGDASDYQSAKWFEENTTITGESLRRAVADGKFLRTVGPKGKKRYSITDAKAIWGDGSFKRESP
jgi:hypothetical protein